jgi:serine/threonine protein kinase
MSTGTSMIVPLQPGEILGKFEIIQLLARDGQAHVYIARVASDQRTPLWLIQRRLKLSAISPAYVEAQRICVIKLAAPDWIDSLRDEHGFLLRPDVRHPRLISLFSDPRSDVSTSRRKEPKGLWFADLPNSSGVPLHLPYITINYLPGGALKHLLEHRGRRSLPPATTVRIALQVAEALEHLHTQAGIIHHDVTPSNIVFRRPLNPLMPQTPDCVLIDLAVADMPGKPRRTQIYGKKTYLPPERLLDKPGSHGPLVDVYGLGVVIYECLAGVLPRTGTDAILNIPLPLPPIREQVAEISDQLAALVNAAVDQDPLQRPTLDQLVNALTHTPEFHNDPGIRSTLTRPILAALATAALVLILLVSGLGLAMAQPAPPRPRPTVTATIPQPTPTPMPQPTPTLRPTSTPVSDVPPSPAPRRS